jgi:histidyl-tRNA synthetase
MIWVAAMLSSEALETMWAFHARHVFGQGPNAWHPTAAYTIRTKEPGALANTIEPRTLRGFRDYLPRAMAARLWLLERARQVYRSYGFLPIDTPALEYSEILLGKGGAESDKLIYRFTDHGGRDVALRFDLTVPFARFAGQHIQELGTPFKRYHMGPVWRGENTGQGRYREFWQCDFDTIGTTSNAADIEIVLVIHDLLVALGFDRFQIRVNNRLLLNGLLEDLGLKDQSAHVLRSLDKLPKLGPEVTRDEIVSGGVDSEKADRVLAWAVRPSTTETLDALAASFKDNSQIQEGTARLLELFAVAKRVGIGSERLQLDLSIARGLDYYTGTICETFLNDLPEIGSICSGGRYDNLAGLYTKQVLPGVGASLGLDRLLAAMEKLGQLPGGDSGAPVFIVQFDQKHLADYFRMAQKVHAAGWGAAVYPDAKKIGAQLQYAERGDFRVALIAGPDEFAKGTWKIKDLRHRAETVVTEAEVMAGIAQILGEEPPHGAANAANQSL